MTFSESYPALGRRTFVTGALAGLLSSAAGPTGAAPLLAVPQVERLSLQVVIDNAVFGPFLADEQRSGLQVERWRETGARMSRQALMAEFGLSLLAQSALAGQERQVLVDFGYTPEVMANNLALLKIDPDRIDAAVLSHGHLDHYGGFAGLFRAAPPRPRSLPLLVGTLDRAELARAGLKAQIAPQPMILADHAFTSGVIPLATSERASIPTAMRPGVGCTAADLSAAKRGAQQIPDDAEHELATCYAVKGLGLVVISSCSHRGVLNAVRQAQAVSGIDKIHAVVGGFHLVRPRTEDEARATAAELARLNPAYIVPMHCSGEVFIAEALRLMPQKVVRPYVGSKFIFAA
jgi:7,8-dihydropterin-6-yl-methyl-4-(beta-D-ribofuranosyl)aminobenzene 5'-phosphate synthase